MADILGCPHFDADDFYWLPGDPPYQSRRNAGEREQMLTAALSSRYSWILSGSIENWGLSGFECDLIVFLTAGVETRLQRLQAREQQRFGARIQPPDGDLYPQHKKFLDWAAQYDVGNMPGRSRARHEAWLLALTKPLLRLDGNQSRQALVAAALRRVQASG